MREPMDVEAGAPQGQRYHKLKGDAMGERRMERAMITRVEWPPLARQDE
jgi:hypothetical protein